MSPFPYPNPASDFYWLNANFYIPHPFFGNFPFLICDPKVTFPPSSLFPMNVDPRYPPLKYFLHLASLWPFFFLPLLAIAHSFDDNRFFVSFEPFIFHFQPDINPLGEGIYSLSPRFYFHE